VQAFGKGLQRSARRCRPTLVGGFLCLIAAAGCASKPAATVRAHEGVAVRVACPAGAAAGVLAGYSKVWALENHARVEVVPGDQAEGQQTADVWVIAPAELGRLVALDQVLPLPEAVLGGEGRYGWKDLLPLYRTKLLVYDRRPRALPLLGGAPLCYYRSDLLADPAHRAAFQQKYGRSLGPPATWDEYAAIAEYFNGRARDGGSPPFPSLTPLPDSDDALDREFYSVAAPLARRGVREEDKPPPPEGELFSFHFDLATGRPRIDTPGFVEALRLLRRLQACRPGTPATEPAATFRDGRAVLCLAGTEWVGRFQEERSAVRGRFGVCRVPGSRRVYDYRTGRALSVPHVNHVPYLGAEGWLAVVPRTAGQPDAAFSLIAELSGPRTSSEILLDPAWAGGVFRREQFNLLTSGDPLRLGTQGANAWSDALRQTVAPNVINPVIRLRVPHERQYTHALSQAVRAFLLGNDGDPRGALATAARRWQEIGTAEGEASRRSAYTQSLNLKAP
jgi:multiple sugar transport system substrate-binding protein